MSYDKYEDIVQDLLIKLKQPMFKALKDSVEDINNLDEIILVGGSTKMPLIKAFVAKTFSKLPLAHINPDEIVCIGAGICAAMKGRNEDFKETVLTDVCPFTLGTGVVAESDYGTMEEGRFLPIIERNTTIPCSRVETLTTIYDNQTQVKIEIYQGESRLVKNNLFLGEIDISLPHAPKGTHKIEVRYTYDVNGILEVEVKTLDTDKVARKVIVNSSVEMSPEEIVRSLEKLKDIKIHPREESKNKYLIAKAERLYEESLSDIRKIISSELDNFESVLNRQNPSEIELAAELFEDFIEGIENQEY
jgi:molecular chaperone HscC